MATRSTREERDANIRAAYARLSKDDPNPSTRDVAAELQQYSMVHIAQVVRDIRIEKEIHDLVWGRMPEEIQQRILSFADDIWRAAEDKMANESIAVRTAAQRELREERRLTSELSELYDASKQREQAALARAAAAEKALEALGGMVRPHAENPEVVQDGPFDHPAAEATSGAPNDLEEPAPDPLVMSRPAPRAASAGRRDRSVKVKSSASQRRAEMIKKTDAMGIRAEEYLKIRSPLTVKEIGEMTREEFGLNDTQVGKAMGKRVGAGKPFVKIERGVYGLKQPEGSSE